MTPTFRTALLLALAILARPASAATPKVKDHAHLFSEPAVRQAAEQLLDIQRRYRADVVVEAFQKVPFHRDPWRKFKKMDAAARETFFRNWARARVPGPDGIYVLIFQGPDAKHIQVQLGRDVRAAGEFTPADGQELRERLRAELDAGRNDEALLETVRLIQSRLDANLGGSVAPRPFDWSGAAALITPVAGLWVALVLIQVFRGGDFGVPFGGVTTLGLGVGCHFAACLRAALESPEPAPAVPAAAEHAGEEALHPPNELGYPEHVHDQ